MGLALSRPFLKKSLPIDPEPSQVKVENPLSMKG